MKTAYDITAIGEALIDMLPSAAGASGNAAYEICPGGAPVNCVAAASSLGAESAFIGAVGEDIMGDYIEAKLAGAGVNVSGMSRTKEAFTTMTFVTPDIFRERNFTFVRKPGADMMLSKDCIDLSIIDNSRILHFGTLLMSGEKSREAQMYAIEYAKSKGKMLSYDVNLREGIFSEESEQKSAVETLIAAADVIKVTAEELSYITGQPQNKIEQGAELLMKGGKTAVFVTMGARGAYYISENEHGFVRAYNVDAVDTLACGDAFMGAALYMLSRKPENMLRETVNFACAVGALTAAVRGGMQSVPTLSEVRSFIESRPRLS